jgi:hypothetical protein
MAKKRAQVDCTLTATGASDLLSQDLEDLPPGSQPEYADAEWMDAPAEPRRSSAPDPNAKLWQDIEATANPVELAALIPRLKTLTGDAKEEGRRRYIARKQAVEAPR